jgi:hypothetical protein
MIKSLLNSLLFLTACGTHSSATVTPTPTPAPANEVYLHTGSVLNNVTLLPIFWGTNWTTDDTYNGVNNFFNGLVGSDYFKTINEYGIDTSTIEISNSVWDKNESTSLTPADANSLANEACKFTNYTPDNNIVYIFIADTPPGNGNDCAWHSSFECTNDQGVQNYATMEYIPNLENVTDCHIDGDSSGHSVRLAATANVIAHETVETLTDPYDGWYDSEDTDLCAKGQNCEVGDKCSWTFSNNLIEFSNNIQWKLQLLWSNKAYESKTGNMNELNQPGCIGG